MTQPSFVPIAETDQVRPSYRLRVPGAWGAHRPAELVLPGQPSGRQMGKQGPNLGFALRLARRFEGRLRLTPEESEEDVVVGCGLIAARRSGMFGRAPSIRDLQLVYTLWGLLDEGAPAELVDERVAAFRSAAHEYTVQRQLVDSVPESTLRLTADQARARLGEWRTLLDRPDPAAAATPGSGE